MIIDRFICRTWQSYVAEKQQQRQFQSKAAHPRGQNHINKTIKYCLIDLVLPPCRSTYTHTRDDKLPHTPVLNYIHSHVFQLVPKRILKQQSTSFVNAFKNDPYNCSKNNFYLNSLTMSKLGYGHDSKEK